MSQRSTSPMVHRESCHAAIIGRASHSSSYKVSCSRLCIDMNNVSVRTIQYNMLKMRDKYLHTNCLAALANMSGQFKGLHPYVAQRIVSLFETLARKHARLVDGLQGVDDAGEDGFDEVSEAVQDAAVLEEVLRMVLEIINSCIVHQTQHNPNLIYTILYKKDLFEIAAKNPAFQVHVNTIQYLK